MPALNLSEASGASINDIAHAVGVPNVEGLRYHVRNQVVVAQTSFLSKKHTGNTV
ncbi:MAG: hypothetical protein JKY12_07690 [Sneathiella sp.]|nr:hypothetical protein [Sneathiella sp.]